jgi:hypothetical protein
VKLFMEIFGYFGFFFLVISITMNDMLKLRTYNAIGSFIFTIYGMYSETYPIMAVNLYFLIMNLYQIRKLRRER